MPHPVDLKVGQKIREIRLIRGWSQEELSVHLKISFQQVQKYEKAANRISASRLWEIARVLQVPVTDFFDGVMKNEEQPPLSRQAIRCAHQIEMIRDEALRNHIASLIRACVNSQTKG